MKKYLFVGGIADGHMIDVDNDYGYWKVPYIESISVNVEELCEWCKPIKEETYRKIQYKCSDNEIINLFILESFKDSDVTKILIDNYKPKQDVELDTQLNSVKQLLNECLSLMSDSLSYITNRQLSDKIWKTTIKIFKILKK